MTGRILLCLALSGCASAPAKGAPQRPVCIEARDSLDESSPPVWRDQRGSLAAAVETHGAMLRLGSASWSEGAVETFDCETGELVWTDTWERRPGGVRVERQYDGGELVRTVRVPGR